MADYEGGFHLQQESINKAVYEIIPLVQEYNKAVKGGLARFAVPAFNNRLQSKVNEVLDKYDLFGDDAADGILEGLDRSGIVVPLSIKEQIKSLALHEARKFNVKKGQLDKRDIRSNNKESKDAKCLYVAKEIARRASDKLGYHSTVGDELTDGQMCQILVDNGVADESSRRKIFEYLKRNHDILDYRADLGGVLLNFSDKQVKERANSKNDNPYRPRNWEEEADMESQFATDIIPLLPDQEIYKNEKGEWESQDYYWDKEGRIQLKPETKSRILNRQTSNLEPNEYGPDGRDFVGKREKQFGKSREVYKNPLATLPKEIQVFPAYTEDGADWIENEYNPTVMKEKLKTRPINE